MPKDLGIPAGTADAGPADSSEHNSDLHLPSASLAALATPLASVQAAEARSLTSTP